MRILITGISAFTGATLARELVKEGLFLPYPPKGRMTRLYQTRFPTKLSEYCWAGMSILVTGPEDAKGSRWAKRQLDAAVTGNCYAEKILGPILKKLASENDWRAQMHKGLLERLKSHSTLIKYALNLVKK